MKQRKINPVLSSFLDDLGFHSGALSSRAAADQVEEARQLLDELVAKTKQPQSLEEASLLGIEIALAGVRLNERRLRLLALLVHQTLSPQ